MTAVPQTATTAGGVEPDSPSSAPDFTMFPVLSNPNQRLADDDGKGLFRILRQSDEGDRIVQAMREPVVGSMIHSGAMPSSGEFFSRIAECLVIAGARNANLRDALRDLDEAAAEAREEKFPVPRNAALANARQLLLAMYKISPQRFEVYPTPDGEIAIDAPGGRGRSILLLCDSEGGALCLVNMNGRHRRACYSSAGLLPDGFIREALDELAQRDELAA